MVCEYNAILENKRKSSKKIQLRSKLSFKVGTPLYLSPEQAVGVVYDEKVDIYAIGLTLLELWYNFSTHHEKLMGFENIKKQKLPQSVEENMKDEAVLIKILTDPDPSKRPTANNIIKLKNYKSWKKDWNGTFNLLNSAHK